MTGLFTGIIGSLIGAGIQATVGGIPVSEDAFKAIDVLRQGGLPVPPANWFSSTVPKEDNSKQIQPFDKIGQHVAGAHQVLGSCMKIAKALEDFAYPRSESQPAAVLIPQVELARAKATFCKSAQANDPVLLSTVGVSKKGCDCQCVCAYKTTSTGKPIDCAAEMKPWEKFRETSKPVEDKRKIKTEKSSMSPLEKFTVQKKGNFHQKGSKNQGNSLFENEISCSGKGRKVKNDPWERDLKPDKCMVNNGILGDSKNRRFCGSTVAEQSTKQKGRSQSVKPENKYGKSVFGTCQMCQVQIKKVNEPRLMPCGHIFCHRCLTGQKPLKCPKCMRCKI